MRNFVAAMVRVWNLPFVKYAVISIIGIILVGFAGENSLWAHLRNKHYIGVLADEIEAGKLCHDDIPLIFVRHHRWAEKIVKRAEVYGVVETEDDVLNLVLGK